MIDIHSHILPGVDDGSQDIEMTLKMLREASKDGTKKLVATPHYCREYGYLEYSTVKTKVNELKSKVKEENIDIELFHGQEIYYEENILEWYNENKIGTINDTKYMLIELPLNKFEINKVIDAIYEIQIKGIVPILAHPERYLPFMDNPEKINDFINEGFLFQMNSGSINGRFGKSAKKTSEIFLENRIYSFIGSDAHNDSNRKTGISEALERIKDIDNEYNKIFEENSIKMLNDEEVKFIGSQIKKKKKGLFSIFR